jgi:DNA primase
MKYPKTYIEEIKNRLKVSDVVRLKVNLKKRGKEFIGLSPFKNEKTPSFTVNDEKGFYHCFSTGEHGNIFDFLMKLDNIGFGEAVKSLAQRAGMQPYRFTKEDEKIEREKERIQKLFSIYFFECKKNLHNDYKLQHLRYLSDRGLTLETINFFEIGFCDNTKSIQEKLFKEEFTADELVNSGLFYKKDNSDEIVNRFRNRITFPIKSYFGEYIGSGGRTVLQNALAKYINSPETNFFKKGFNLYNLNNSKQENKSGENSIVLVEGYMDAVSLYNVGIKNVAATLGTAITTAQINLAWKNFDKVIICFDGDQSGQDAMYRAAERVLKIIQPGKDIYFAKLPHNLDPDDFTKQFGKEGFDNIIAQSKDLTETIFNHHSKNIDGSKASDVSLLEKNLFNLANQVEDQTSQKYLKSSFKNKIFENLIKKGKSRKVNSAELKQASMRLMLSKKEITELSLFNLILNYPELTENKIEELSSLEFDTDENKQFSQELINSLINDKLTNSNDLKKKMSLNFENIISKIENYSNNKEILSSMDPSAFEDFFNDYLAQLFSFKKDKELMAIEAELSKNPSESVYNKYLSLKNS